jgi:glycogen debranching enzyme
MIQFKRETCRDLAPISEIFEGGAPHRPCGCIAQALSVAGILRVYVEEVRGPRPNSRSSGRPRSYT